MLVCIRKLCPRIFVKHFHFSGRFYANLHFNGQILAEIMLSLILLGAHWHHRSSPSLTNNVDPLWIRWREIDYMGCPHLVCCLHPSPLRPYLFSLSSAENRDHHWCTPSKLVNIWADHSGLKKTEFWSHCNTLKANVEKFVCTEMLLNTIIWTLGNKTKACHVFLMNNFISKERTTPWGHAWMNILLRLKNYTSCSWLSCDENKRSNPAWAGWCIM